MLARTTHNLHSVDGAQMLGEVITHILRPVDLHTEASPIVLQERYVEQAIKRGMQRDRATRIYQLYRAYRQQLKKEHLCDEHDLLMQVFTLLRQDKLPDAMRYDYVFLDEAQDFHQGEWAIAWALCRHPANFFLAGDEAQQLSPSGFSLHHVLALWNRTDFLANRMAGPPTVDSVYFPISFRNPKPVVEVALRYRELGSLQTVGRELVPIPDHDGPDPILIRTPDPFDTILRLVASSASRTCQVITLEKGSFLTSLNGRIRTHPILPAMLPDSESGEIPFYDPYDAKGGEAEVVILGLPFRARGAKCDRFDWNRWYVALTRCTERLLLVETDGHGMSGAFLDPGILGLHELHITSPEDIWQHGSILGLDNDRLFAFEAMEHGDGDSVKMHLAKCKDLWAVLRIHMLFGEVGNVRRLLHGSDSLPHQLHNNPFRDRRIEAALEFVFEHSGDPSELESIAERFGAGNGVAHLVRRLLEPGSPNYFPQTPGSGGRLRELANSPRGGFWMDIYAWKAALNANAQTLQWRADDLKRCSSKRMWRDLNSRFGRMGSYFLYSLNSRLQEAEGLQEKATDASERCIDVMWLTERREASCIVEAAGDLVDRWKRLHVQYADLKASMER